MTVQREGIPHSIDDQIPGAPTAFPGRVQAVSGCGVAVLGTAHFSLFRSDDGVEAFGMCMYRIGVLCTMFFLVALSPHVDVAVTVIVLGVSLYAA